MRNKTTLLCVNVTLVAYMGKKKKQLKFKAHELGENDTSQVNKASMFSQTVGDCGSMKPWNEYYVGKYFWTRGILAILSSKILRFQTP